MKKPWLPIELYWTALRKLSLLAIALTAVLFTLVLTDNFTRNATSPNTIEAHSQAAFASTLGVDLVGHWTLNDGTAQDSSGNGNHGTLVGGPAPAAGQIGGATKD